jgi:hypothetical protein
MKNGSTRRCCSHTLGSLASSRLVSSHRPGTSPATSRRVDVVSPRWPAATDTHATTTAVATGKDASPPERAAGGVETRGERLGGRRHTAALEGAAARGGRRRCKWRSGEEWWLGGCSGIGGGSSSNPFSAAWLRPSPSPDAKGRVPGNSRQIRGSYVNM